MTRFVAWWQDGAYSSTGSCFDIGMTVRGALTRFQETGDPIAGSTDPMSAGNGSLMRLAPVAIRYWDDPAGVADAAARQSRTTHAAPEAVAACVGYAQILADAIAGKSRCEVLRSRDGGYAGAIAGILAGSWRGKRREDVKASGYVAHSLEAALWCVGRTGTFAEAVLLAANLGEDADTTAAIAGQLAGALYGYEAIPRPWLGKLHAQGMIFGMATSLLDATSARKELPPVPD
jgi:ADP-ribosyl-[dinitrogen reductase] hydrolase